jgi:hypothetical protein
MIVEGCDGELRNMDRWRLHRQGMPCKQARRDVSADRLEALWSFRKRSVRVVADNNKPEIDEREMFSNLRRRRCRFDRSGPLRNVSGNFGW